MGGYPHSLTGGKDPLGLPTGGQLSDLSGDGPRTVAEEARRKLFLDAFPGLAGALRIASLHRDGLMRRLAGAAQPRNIGSFGAGIGAQPRQRLALTRPVSDVVAPYANQSPSQLASAVGRNRQAPANRAAPKVPQSPPGPRTATALDTKDNINDLARIIMSEASTGNYAERPSVGFTVLNRMRRNGTARVRDVSTGYAHNQAATPDAVFLATSILKNQFADPTNGATHFYSPGHMPKEKENTAGFDVGGGLEQSGRLRQKNYRPGYAKTWSAMSIPNVREENFKFWRAPGSGPVR